MKPNRGHTPLVCEVSAVSVCDHASGPYLVDALWISALAADLSVYPWLPRVVLGSGFVPIILRLLKDVKGRLIHLLFLLLSPFLSISLLIVHVRRSCDIFPPR